MKTLVIDNSGEYTIPDAQRFDLKSARIHNCVGCWTCWWKTPGKCAYSDLEDFYRGYIAADRVVIFEKPENGFVSVKLKTLLDRAIPLFMPYTTFAEGGTWHEKRYPKYPDVTLYYDCDFDGTEDKSIFCDYIQKVFSQFLRKEHCSTSYF